MIPHMPAGRVWDTHWAALWLWLWFGMGNVGDSRSPVDFRVFSLVNDLLNDVEVEVLSQVVLDQGDPLLGGHRRHDGQAVSLGRAGW